MRVTRKHVVHYTAIMGLTWASTYSALAAQHSRFYQRRLRDGVARCRANGRDPEQFLLGVLAGIQSMQRFPIRGVLHRVEVECVRRELDRVARDSAGI